jgi:[ribosomal protein S5]-alanine N-acetyltransferase
MKAKKIETNRLLLKPLSLEHLTQDYVDWLNDIEVNQYLETGGNYTLDMLKDYLTDVVKKDIYFWAIHIKNSGLHIGNIKIDPVNLKHGTAEYGIMMGRKSEWKKGYAKEASLAIIDYCFEEIGIRKITLGVVASHINAAMLYYKIGFGLEGTLKKQGIYNNIYCDALRMAIFNPNFHYED